MHSNNAKEKRPSKAQATASKDGSWPPSHMHKVLLFWPAPGWPCKGFLVWKPSFFFSFFSPPLNREDDSWTECFGGIFLPALFLGMNSMLVNMENNIGILTLHPMVSYALSAIPQPGAAWGLPSASLTSSWWPSLWSKKRARSPDPIKFEVFLLKLLKRNYFNTDWSETDLQVFCFCQNQALTLDINLRSGMQLLFLQKLNLWT